MSTLLVRTCGFPILSFLRAGNEPHGLPVTKAKTKKGKGKENEGTGEWWGCRSLVVVVVVAVMGEEEGGCWRRRVCVVGTGGVW